MEKDAAIICVDDEPMILNSLRTELRDAFGEQYLIEVAENGEDALEVLNDLKEEGFEVPVIISDYIMPEMKGDVLLTEVHQRMPSTRKIMLTGQAGLEGVTKALNNANLYRYLTKPWSPEDLKMTVEKAVVSFYQEQQLELTNRELTLLNASLEDKVLKRTEELSKSNDNLANATDELSKKNKIIEAKNRNIRSSINYAKRLQTATLPSIQTIQSYLPQSFVFYKPRDVVSGDFYWVEKIENKVVIVVSDCTGHGIPGAFLSTIGIVLLNKIVLDGKVTDPNLILSEMNYQVQQTFRHNISEIADGMDMAICTLDLDTNMLEFSGAKNPLLLLQKNALTVIKGDKKPISGGHFRKNIEYQKHSFRLNTNDQFFLYTDGFQDQFGGESGKKLMAGNFRKNLFQAAQLPVRQQHSFLEKYLNEWLHNTYKQIDDILVVGIKL